MKLRWQYYWISFQWFHNFMKYDIHMPTLTRVTVFSNIGILQQLRMNDVQWCMKQIQLVLPHFVASPYLRFLLFKMLRWSYGQCTMTLWYCQYNDICGFLLAFFGLWRQFKYNCLHAPVNANNQHTICEHLLELPFHIWYVWCIKN